MSKFSRTWVAVLAATAILDVRSQSLRAQAAAPVDDTSYYTLSIERVSRTDSAAAYDVGIGLRFHCPRDQARWNGSGKSFQIAARRVAGKYWSISATLVTMTDPAECP